jgi:hypothetical protein
LDICKSKLVVGQLQSFNKGKAYVSLISSTNLNKIVFENNFRKGSCKWGHNYNIKHFNHTFSTNYKSKWFFTIKKVQDFPQTSFVPHHPFWWELLKQKN